MSATSAPASTVQLDGTRIVYAGGPGEHNILRLASEEGRLIIDEVDGRLPPVGDVDAAHITAGSGCVTLDDTKAACPLEGVSSVELSLGDAIDEAGFWDSAPPPEILVVIDGGPDGDYLYADRAREIVDGGDGHDFIEGDAWESSRSAEPDHLRGGPGHDIVQIGAGAIASGGEGLDVASFTSYGFFRRSGSTVSTRALARRPERYPHLARPSSRPAVPPTRRSVSRGRRHTGVQAGA